MLRKCNLSFCKYMFYRNMESEIFRINPSLRFLKNSFVCALKIG